MDYGRSLVSLRRLLFDASYVANHFSTDGGGPWTQIFFTFRINPKTTPEPTPANEVDEDGDDETDTPNTSDGRRRKGAYSAIPCSIPTGLV